MPPTGAKACRQKTYGRTISKKVSNDSCVGSLASSSVWALREAPLNAPASSTIKSQSNSAYPKHPDFGQFSSVPCPRSVVPTELGQPSNAGHGRGKVRRVQSWLKEQQRIISTMDETSREDISKAAGTPCNPYLAYPGLARYTSWQDGDEDDDILSSFVIVEEEELEEEDLGASDPANTFEHAPHGMLSTSTPAHSNSVRPSSLRPSRPSSILSVSSWRQLPFTKTLPRRYPSAPGEPIDLSTPPASIRISSTRQRSPIPEDFLLPEAKRTAQNKSSCGTLKAPDTPRSSVRKRLGGFMRPHESVKVNSHSSASLSSTGSPRPSTSASATTATTSTAVENERRSETGASPKRRLPKFNLKLSKTVRQPPEDIRLDSPTRSSFSSTLHLEEPEHLSPLRGHSSSHPDHTFTPTLSKRPSQPSIFRDKRHNASSSALSTLSIGSIGTLASNINGRASGVFSNSSAAKKKRLVVSGIAPDDTAALHGLRKWCESFGELQQMTRMPNGDLLIDFKRADVADTVCRISARVHIAEVGSVNVSWITGKRH